MKWVCGDIHGMVHTVRGLVDRIDGEDREAELVFVGDYVDRGPESAQVVEYLIELQKDRPVVCLRGNHDEFMDFFLNGTCEGGLGVEGDDPEEDFGTLVWWISNGSYPTLTSYGITEELDVLHIAAELRKRVPEAHKAFFRGLELYWRCETHFACHGYFPPDQPPPVEPEFSVEAKSEILWSRFGASEDYGGGTLDRDFDTTWDIVGVFGHTPTECYGERGPIASGQVRLVDTGACLGGGLTGYCCEEDRFVTVAADDRDLAGI